MGWRTSVNVRPSERLAVSHRSQPRGGGHRYADGLSDEQDPTPEELPPAGWFADPEHPGQLRWWDGAQWSEHRTTDPAGAPAASPGQWRTGPETPAGPPRTSGWAIASVISGAILGPLPAIVFGFIARRKIRDSGGTLTGEVIANVGIALGGVWVVVLAIMFATGEFSDSSNSGDYKGSEKPVAALVDDVETALSKRDGSRACSTLFTPVFASRIANGSGQTCAEFVSDALGKGDVQASIDVKAIDITGSSAHVDVTEGGDAQRWDLERVGNGWRVDDISA